jgi:Asp-tRNA(Asn)/Glu-tRNA(Gln) amidotransferase A subunit family amidase
VVGFKPTYGVVPRTGILRQSRALDTVGVMARTVPDAALIMECIAGYDAGDPDTRPSARVPYARIAAEEPPLPPTLGFVRTPVWDRADAETRAAFDELIAHLGDRIQTLELPATLAAAWDWHRTIMEADIAASFVVEYERGAERLSASLRQQIERGRSTLAFDYLHALAHIPRLNEDFAEIYERVDALVTPSAPGAAPEGLDRTGDPAFCTLWTLCGMPAVTLPLLSAGNGLPIGVQLVGKRGDDARLLRTAHWLTRQVQPKE